MGLKIYIVKPLALTRLRPAVKLKAQETHVQT